MSRITLEQAIERRRARKEFAQRIQGDLTFRENYTGVDKMVPSPDVRQERLVELTTDIIVQMALEDKIRHGGIWQELMESDLVNKSKFLALLDAPENELTGKPFKPGKPLPTDPNAIRELTIKMVHLGYVKRSADIITKKGCDDFWAAMRRAERKGVPCQMLHPCVQWLESLHLRKFVDLVVPLAKSQGRAQKKASLYDPILGTNFDDEMGTELADTNRLMIVPATIKLGEEFYQHAAINARELKDVSDEVLVSEWRARPSGAHSRNAHFALTIDVNCPANRTFQGTLAEIKEMAPEQAKAYLSSHPIYEEQRHYLDQNHQPDLSLIKESDIPARYEGFKTHMEAYMRTHSDQRTYQNPLIPYDLIDKLNKQLRANPTMPLEDVQERMEEIEDNALASHMPLTYKAAHALFQDAKDVRDNVRMNTLVPLLSLARDEGLRLAYERLTGLHLSYHIEAVKRSTPEWQHAWAVDSLLYNSTLTPGNPLSPPIREELIEKTVGPDIFAKAKQECAEKLRNAPLKNGVLQTFDKSEKTNAR